MDCLFCAIANGDIPSQKVYEDSFKDKEAFIKKFIRDNNERFEFLYLKESQITRKHPNYLLEETVTKINSFFKD